jgi:hypothetical protein
MEPEYSDEENFQKKKYVQINEDEDDKKIDIDIGIVENKKAKNVTSLSSKSENSIFVCHVFPELISRGGTRETPKIHVFKEKMVGSGTLRRIHRNPTKQRFQKTLSNPIWIPHLFHKKRKW